MNEQEAREKACQKEMAMAYKCEPLSHRLAYKKSGFEYGFAKGWTVRGDAWVPVSGRLPDRNGWYLVTVEWEHARKRFVLRVWYTGGEWDIPHPHHLSKVTAWQPLPTPYQQHGGQDEQ